MYGVQGGGIKFKRGGRGQGKSCLESRQIELQSGGSLCKTYVDLPSDADRRTRCTQNIDLFGDAVLAAAMNEAVLAAATETLPKR